MTRILVAEDSSTARELLVAILRAEPGFEVVGEARNGEEAVEMTCRLRPDVVTMDGRMPVLDGLGATKRIMIHCPTPVVIVTASMEPGDVEASMRALRAGALAILPKPPGPGAPGFDAARRELVDTVSAMSQVRVVRHWPETARRAPRAAQGGEADRRGRVLAIAASTGGPAALQTILASLPGDFPAPILVVQHIARGFVPGIVSWLDGATPLGVQVASEGEALRPGVVYFAPDDRHMGVVAEGSIRLSEEAPIEGFRPSASFLFRSVAEGYGRAAVCAILTGMGRDGVEGLRAVRERGGRVLSQAEEGCVVYGMPRAAQEAGLVDEVVGLAGIATRVVRMF
ncbi:MAG: chemotaxis-specific protein-glutamate methyltransferase CheB [Planctomycetota bacterium]|mgnify:CR=1 FL=1